VEQATRIMMATRIRAPRGARRGRKVFSHPRGWKRYPIGKDGA